MMGFRKGDSIMVMRVELVPGYGGFYKVSTTGRVWTCRRTGCIRDRKGPWREMRQFPTKRSPHPVVNLVKDTKHKMVPVHRLVLETFVGPCPDGMETRHYPDRDPTNNNLENLSWATYQTNQRDRAEHGTSNRGERCAASRLKEINVKNIRRVYAMGRRTMQEIADHYDVGLGTIFDVIHNRTWKYI